MSSGDDDILDSGTGTTIDGGDGNDKLTLDRTAIGSGFRLVFSPGSSAATIASDNTSIKNIESLVLLTGSGDDSLQVNQPNYSYLPFTVNWTAGGGNDLATIDLGNHIGAITAGGSSTFAITDSHGTLMQFTGVETFDITGTFSASNDLRGNGGNDRLAGSMYADTLIGNGGNDTLIGNDGADTISGGDGDDVISAQAGSTIDGGPGSDRLTLYGYNGSAPVNFTFTPGSSTTVSLPGGSSFQNIEYLDLRTGSGDDTVTFDKPLRPTATAQNYWDAGAGFDTLILDWSNLTEDTTTFTYPATFHIRIGNDSFTSFSGTSIERLQIAFGSGSDMYNGSDMDETVSGGDGNDYLDGARGRNSLNGGNGNDSLRDSGMGSTLDGGAGTDTAYLDRTSIAASVSLNFTTVAGADSTASDGTVLRNIEGLQAKTGLGDDTVTFDGSVGQTGAELDSWDGGAGSDTFIANYSNASKFIMVDIFTDGTYSLYQYDGMHIYLTNVEHTILTGTSGGDRLQAASGGSTLNGGGGDDRITGNVEHDTLNGGTGNDTLDGGANIDTAAFSGNKSAYALTQTSTGVWQVAGPDGTDTLTNIEYAKFDDQTVRLLPGTGATVDWNASPSTYMTGIRDFDGTILGGTGSWKLIGSADLNGDGTVEHVLVNREIGRWAEVSAEADGKSYFSNFGWAGDTRVLGIYIDPLVTQGIVVKDSDTDSQRRFQNDLVIENIKSVLGQGDYNHDGLQEVYFSLTDGTAYLHAYMHADGNIQYANYQNKQQVIDYLTSNGVSSATWAGWFPAGQSVLAAVAG